MLPGSLSLLSWLLMAAIVAGALMLWRRLRARADLAGIVPGIQGGLTPEDAAALGFLCLARYDSGIALPGNDLYPVHGIFHFRRLPRDFGALSSNDLKGRLQPVRWVCCLQAVDLYRVVMRLHFERHIAGPLFQMTEQEFCDSVRLAMTMVPGARILNQPAEKNRRPARSLAHDVRSVR